MTDYEFEDEFGLEDESCPKCGSDTRTRRCEDCEDGASYHDCGEDTCCCENPMANVRCDHCGGGGWHHWCFTCGWDLIWKQYINGVDERVREAQVVSSK